MDNVNIYDARIRAGKAPCRFLSGRSGSCYRSPGFRSGCSNGLCAGLRSALRPCVSQKQLWGRTFIKPTQKERESAVHLKLSVLSSVVRGKRIVLIDDSIVRSTTMASLIRMLKDAGATKVHVRISSPPFSFPLLLRNRRSQQRSIDRILPTLLPKSAPLSAQTPRLHEAGGLEADDRGSSTLQSML